jgi:hypothetical protein
MTVIDIFWLVGIDYSFGCLPTLRDVPAVSPLKNNLNSTTPERTPRSLGILDISYSNCPKVCHPTTASNQRWPFDDQLRRRHDVLRDKDILNGLEALRENPLE